MIKSVSKPKKHNLKNLVIKKLDKVFFMCIIASRQVIKRKGSEKKRSILPSTVPKLIYRNDLCNNTNF